ncbi:Fur family transcriptional regulator [Cyclobacterium amurskyense]|jgi:Fur family peroxide stress response transcriptional regulator|uniref:Transcriptional regulator, Fur family n=1 Tax=Cyclobacterium amurskyense TaxID=320787 RepID=A0A0H4P9L6_9BACT|nr:transcriptional repressor [Cyclobacterium amurskyense]AKP51176.1 Transcriptional regulator, Fur family [Cyclobacterium amurskyense]|tara:strand:+ start:8839 stop:9258 length:420 start_codon:yes stop_codon:yes gene_type:complete
MKTNINKLKEKITSKGMKFTHQRLVIYRSLCDSKDHPTADMVYNQITEENPSISKGTVYKTLESFVNAGILQKFRDDMGLMRFDPVMDTHSHLYCNESSNIRDYKNPDLEQLLNNFFKENQIEGFEVEEVSLVIKGKSK